MDIRGWVVLGLFVTVLLALAVLGARAAARRRKELEAWASTRGLSFSPGKDRGFRGRYPAFQCLDAGDQDRYAFNVMTGRYEGRPITAFDYHYETEHTDKDGHRSTTSHYFSGVILGSDLPLKPLHIRPESFFDKITEFFGYDDIDFESAEFSRRFYVKSPDRRWAFDVLHPRTMQFLLDRPRFTVQFDTRCAIAYRGSTFSSEEFEAAAQTLAGIFDAFPEYLRRQLKEGH